MCSIDYMTLFPVTLSDPNYPNYSIFDIHVSAVMSQFERMTSYHEFDDKPLAVLCS